MKLLSILVCEDVIRDMTTDNVSLINLIESVKATTFPISLHKFSVYAVFLRENEMTTEVFNGSLTLSNNDIVIEKRNLSFSIPKNRVRMITRFQGLMITEEGKLNIHIEINGKLIEEFSIQTIKNNLSVVNKD